MPDKRAVEGTDTLDTRGMPNKRAAATEPILFDTVLFGLGVMFLAFQAVTCGLGGIHFGFLLSNGQSDIFVTQNVGCSGFGDN